jgi:hypothetical protein
LQKRKVKKSKKEKKKNERPKGQMSVVSYEALKARFEGNDADLRFRTTCGGRSTTGGHALVEKKSGDQVPFWRAGYSLRGRAGEVQRG